MAIGWLAAFKTIPWAEVLAVAPTIVQGARKLWTSVRKQEQPVSPQSHQLDAKHSSDSESLSAIGARVLSLESRSKEMADEVVSSLELIKSLAEQNSRLVQAVEILRVRTRVLVWLFGVLGLVTLALFLWEFLR